MKANPSKHNMSRWQLCRALPPLPPVSTPLHDLLLLFLYSSLFLSSSSLSSSQVPPLTAFPSHWTTTNMIEVHSLLDELDSQWPFPLNGNVRDRRLSKIKYLTQMQKLEDLGTFDAKKHEDRESWKPSIAVLAFDVTKALTVQLKIFFYFSLWFVCFYTNPTTWEVLELECSHWQKRWT